VLAAPVRACVAAGADAAAWNPPELTGATAREGGAAVCGRPLAEWFGWAEPLGEDDPPGLCAAASGVGAGVGAEAGPVGVDGARSGAGPLDAACAGAPNRAKSSRPRRTLRDPAYRHTQPTDPARKGNL
jgi:hypothetical protein